MPRLPSGTLAEQFRHRLGVQVEGRNQFLLLAKLVRMPGKEHLGLIRSLGADGIDLRLQMRR